MIPEYNLIARQNSNSSCVQCNASPVPQCMCPSSTKCVFQDESCDKCASFSCEPISSPSGGKKVSAGAVAGAVIGSLIFLALVVAGYLYYRRRMRQAEVPVEEETKPDVPARAEDVLGRPDPNEMAQTQAQDEEQSTIRVYSGSSSAVINLDPLAQQNASATAVAGHSTHPSIHSNPFRDSHSIHTTSTGGQSNVIPIAFVPLGSTGRRSMEPTVLSSKATAGGTVAPADFAGPVRPARAPDLDININLDHANVSNDSVQDGKSVISQRSGLSTTNNPRMSYMSTGSYASDLLSEAPVIVTPTRGTVKQVVGVVKAEVIRTSPHGSPLGSPALPETPTLLPGSLSAISRPPVRSPLAASSFGPSDVMREVDEEQELSIRNNPFGDEHSPNTRSMPITSPSPSVATFGTPPPGSITPETQTQSSVGYSDEDGEWTNPQIPSSGRRPRPESVNTQAGSIIGSVIIADISNATRVHLGYDRLGASVDTGVPVTPNSAALSTPRTGNRMTSAKLVSPMNGTVSAFERQQQIAMQGIDEGRRVSTSSTSTRADSILEGFPFVPPSPISNRPIRTPPRSPLAEQTFTNAQADEGPKPFPQSSSSKESSPASSRKESHPPVVHRHVSVTSQSSAMSSGLGSFPFQIDSGSTDNNGTLSSSPPSAFLGRQRASLDTLALTSDLSSYPLGFDSKTSNYPPSPRR